MQNDNYLHFGSQVRVISNGPFRGLRGTILQMDSIVDDLEDPFCYYLIALEKTTCAEAIWFEYHEVEFIGSPPPLPLSFKRSTDPKKKRSGSEHESSLILENQRQTRVAPTHLLS